LERTQWTLRFEVGENAKHVGGLTIYGQKFGDYNQDITMRINYEEKPDQ
jgi:predicted transcriptional regulator